MRLHSLLAGSDLEFLKSHVGQDGEMNEDVPEADEGFFVDGEVDDEGKNVKVDALADNEEKSKEAHEVKSKRSPCRPNSAEVATHDKTHLPYRSWCLARVRAKGKEDAQSSGKEGQGRGNRVSRDFNGL